MIKINKMLCCALSLALLASCSNNELGYNEKTASIFLREMENLDDSHKSFLDTAAIFHGDEYAIHRLNSLANAVVKNAAVDISEMKALNPSEAAMPFHSGVLNYFSGIADYGRVAEKLIASTDVSEKKALLTQLKSRYTRLSKMPDSVLALQKVYMDKVGLKEK